MCKIFSHPAIVNVGFGQSYHDHSRMRRMAGICRSRLSCDRSDGLDLQQCMARGASPARPRLVAQDGIIAEHPDHDRTFWQYFDLSCSNVLIRQAVFHHGRASWPWVKTARRAGAEPEHRDQRDGGWRIPASGVGFHVFSPMLHGARPADRRVRRRGGGSAGTRRW